MSTDAYDVIRRDVHARIRQHLVVVVGEQRIHAQHGGRSIDARAPERRAREIRPDTMVEPEHEERDGEPRDEAPDQTPPPQPTHALGFFSHALLSSRFRRVYGAATWTLSYDRTSSTR